MAVSEATINCLAEAISETAKALTAYLEQNGHSAPSFEEGGLEQYPKNELVTGLRFQLLEAASDLYHLALGPADMGFLQPLFWNHDTTILDVLNRFGFFTSVPVGGSATYSDIAARTTLPESLVRRILRHAMTMRLFDEKPPYSGKIVHTSTTAFMSKNPIWRSWVAHNMEDMRPGIVYLPESLKKFSAGKDVPSDDILQSGCAIADFDRVGHPSSLWEYLERTPEGKPSDYRVNRFAEAMQAAALSSVVKTEDLLSTYDWARLGNATVVDVGGSSGHDAMNLAMSFPSLKFIVQDQSANEARFQSNLPADLVSRISFQTHDFFTPQPISADVYMLKMILHDWPNKQAISILQNLKHNLKPGAVILLCENVQPAAFDQEGNRILPVTAHRMASCLDLQMLAVFNNLERTIEQWDALIKEADEHFEIRSVVTVPGSIQSILEVVLNF